MEAQSAGGHAIFACVETKSSLSVRQFEYDDSLITTIYSAVITNYKQQIFLSFQKLLFFQQAYSSHSQPDSHLQNSKKIIFC